VVAAPCEAPESKGLTVVVVCIVLLLLLATGLLTLLWWYGTASYWLWLLVCLIISTFEFVRERYGHQYVIFGLVSYRRRRTLRNRGECLHNLLDNI